MKIAIRIMLILLASHQISFGQNTLKTKMYVDDYNNLEFELSENWEIVLEDTMEKNWFICFSVDSLENEKYRDCFESIIFRYRVVDENIHDFIYESGDYVEINNELYTSDRFSDRVPVKQFQINSLYGYSHVNICGVSCEETGFHAAAGECEYIIIGNSIKTVEISTNGRAFDEELKEIIMNSIKIEK